MFYSLNQLAERTIRDLSGGNIPDDSPYNPVFVKATWRDAINEDLRIANMEKRHGDTDDKTGFPQMIANYLVDVQFDKAQVRAYAAMPDYFVTLKYQRGIHSIGSENDSLITFVKIHHKTVTAHLPHQELERTTHGYYIEGLKVFFLRNILTDKIKKVLIKLIIAAPSSLSDDEPMPLLADSIGRISDIVKARVQNKYPQDRIADNNPNLRQLNEQPR